MATCWYTTSATDAYTNKDTLVGSFEEGNAVYGTLNPNRVHEAAFVNQGADIPGDGTFYRLEEGDFLDQQQGEGANKQAKYENAGKPDKVLILPHLLIVINVIGNRVANGLLGKPQQASDTALFGPL